MLKLSGFANQLISTTVVDAAAWEIDRPRAGFQFAGPGQVGNAFKDNDLAIQVGFTPTRYLENAPGNPYYGGDAIVLSFNINAIAESSYLELVNCTFHVDDANSSVLIYNGIDRNCSVVNNVDFGTVERDANIVLAVDDKSCSDTREVDWIFYDQNSVEHALNISVECVYRSGSLGKKVLFPIVFRVILDAGVGFSDAENISFGAYNRSIDNVDSIDVFAIRLNEGQKINVSVTPPSDTYIEYSLFGPDHVCLQRNDLNSTSVFTYEVKATGNWYIQVRQLYAPGHASEGVYTIGIMEIR